MIEQSHIHLLDLIGGGQFKKVGQTNGGEYHGACPFCGGKDRFIIQPNSDQNGGHWWCRQCDRHGDALGFIMQYEALDFKQACERLNLNLPDRPVEAARPRTPQPPIHTSDLKEDYACFEDSWQKSAYDFAYDCAGKLWDGWQSLSAARYLEGRGVDRNTAVASFLGVNTEDYHATWGSVNVWLPRGITIPWEIDKSLWNVRVRRPNADLTETGGDKYMSPKGSANGVYDIDSVLPGDTVVMTEGEFDSIVLKTFFLRRKIRTVGVVSVGSCSGGRVLRFITRLALAKKIVIAFDNDSAGNQAADYWQMVLYPKASRLTPVKKDVTEMWQSGELPGWIGEVS